MAGVYGLFDVITSGKDETKENKPNPEIYSLTARKLNLLPQNCLAIEDSAPGIEAAKRAGMICVGYKNPHSGNQDMSKADFIVDDFSLSSLSKIFKYLFSTFQLMTEKAKTVEIMEKIAEGLRADNKKIVTTNGSFDILHAAHINLLEKAKQEGDILIVLLNSDSSIKRAKGEKRPIVSELERAKMLSALEAVDYIAIFNEDKPLNYIERIKPHVHVKGGSVIETRMSEEKELISKWDGEYKQFPLEEGFSTTSIIDRIIKAYKN